MSSQALSGGIIHNAVSSVDFVGPPALLELVLVDVDGYGFCTMVSLLDVLLFFFFGCCCCCCPFFFLFFLEDDEDDDEDMGDAMDSSLFL